MQEKYRDEQAPLLSLTTKLSIIIISEKKIFGKNALTEHDIVDKNKPTDTNSKRSVLIGFFSMFESLSPEHRNHLDNQMEIKIFKNV